MKKYGTIIIYVLLAVLIVFLATGGFDFSTNEPDQMTYKDFLTMVRNNEVSAVQITDGTLYGLYAESEYTEEQFFEKGKYEFYLTIPSEQTFTSDMAKIFADINGVSVDAITSADYNFSYQYNPDPEPSFFATWMPTLLLIGAMGLLFYFVMRQQSGGKMANFGKSPARTGDTKNKVTFADVAGADEEKEEMSEMVEFLRDPKRFSKLGARIPKGVLLVGPPGTGKTLLAKAVAGEANVPFFSISGSDFVEMFVGVGASRVRDLFNTAKKAAPSIVFIDEIDAVGRHRGAGLGGGHDEREQTLNQLLVEMDGFAPNEGIIVIAATNRPDILDPALLRPGRFDRQVTVNYPDVKGREEILNVHAKGKPFADEVDMSVLAKRTPGFTGADLENVLNEGAILTARRKKERIGMDELEEAITRVIAGPEKRSRVVTAADNRITAYHESGHAILALKLDHCDDLHEVSIIPRGQAAGYTMTLPKDEDHHMSRGKLLDNICMLLGGRVAESIALDDVCTGAINDLQRASDIARRMVVEYGMSDIIGPVYLGSQDSTEVFIGRDWGHTHNYSEEVASQIDEEIRRILDEQFARARGFIGEDMEALERVVKYLLEHERIDGDAFARLYRDEEPPVPPEKPEGPDPKKELFDLINGGTPAGANA